MTLPKGFKVGGFSGRWSRVNLHAALLCTVTAQAATAFYKFVEQPEPTKKTGKVDLKQRRKKSYEAQWKSERRK